jgi:hypothetical protein
MTLRPSQVAWFAVATHVVAAGGMLFLLRRGLPGFPEDERLAYMAAHRAAWLGGWMVWQLAAISLLAFYVVLARRLNTPLAMFALPPAIAGLALDIASESRYMAILPELRGDAFVTLDRELEVLIGYGANGLYTVALVLLVVAGWRVLPISARVLSVPVAISGFALAYASLVHDARLETITSAILFPLFTLMLMAIALWLRREESS